MPAPNTQKLINDIQRAGFDATIDIDSGGMVFCQILGPLDRFGAQEVLEKQAGKLLHKTLLRCWMQVSKRARK